MSLSRFLGRESSYSFSPREKSVEREEAERVLSHLYPHE